MNTITLESGTVLQLKPVSQSILQELIQELAKLIGEDPTVEPEAIYDIQDVDDQLKALALVQKLMTYCAGWGVVNSPNGQQSELQELLGATADKPYQRRAMWVLHELCSTDAERSAVMSAVMTLTFKRGQPPKEADTVYQDIYTLVIEESGGQFTGTGKTAAGADFSVKADTRELLLEAAGKIAMALDA